MEQLGGSRKSVMGNAISELQWAHETLIRITSIVQTNGLLTDRLSECVVQLSKATVLLEGLIQEHLRDVRRRHDD